MAGELSRAVEWVLTRILFDRQRGRQQSDFATQSLSQAVTMAAKSMSARGFETFQGGGNVFFVREEPGKNPLVVQARPLAQRTVRLRFI